MKDVIYIMHGYEEDYDGEPPVVIMVTTDIKIAISKLKNNGVALDGWKNSKRVFSCCGDNPENESYVCGEYEVRDEKVYKEVSKYIPLERLSNLK
ncbi:hypothetical protein COJ02_25755 [Bacillus thuringiensis]|uniref:hypothetical protein n=1 Tax=Bacillus thuringiensis TaxID=1428 RepID=UPI000BF5AE95|nr:hypothetical protein [Bacillus thuringiensis]PFJ51048.1 hypothetical protein COJ02_25755 [Bacillus thuringiensis]